MNRIFIIILSQIILIHHFIFRPTTVGVRALIFHNKKILLIRHSYTDGWFFPGGGLGRPPESLEDALKREVKEEVNLEVMHSELLYAHRNFRKFKKDTVINYFVKVKDIESLKIDNSEIIEYGWYALDDLPKYIHSLTLNVLTANSDKIKTYAERES